MADMTDFDALVNRLGELFPAGPPPRRELLCGPGVIMWLRVLIPEDGPSFPWSQTPPFTGIPLIHAPELGRGEWELRENGEVVKCGRFDLPEPADFTPLTPTVFDLDPPFRPRYSAFESLALYRLAMRPSYPLVLGSVI